MSLRKLFTCLVALGILAGACDGGGTPPTGDLNVTMRDDGIDLSTTTLPAGELTVVGTNQGSETHEFEVFRVPEGIDADALPVEDDVAAADDMLVIVDEREDVAPGTSAELTVSLEAGTYAVICNLPGHYARGMHATLTVE